MEREALKLAKIIEHFDSNDESLPLELLKEIAATLRALVQPVQEPLAHTVIAGALFDFMGYLTSRKERIVLSAADDAAPAADAIRDFATKRGLLLDDAQVREWIDELAQPPLPVQRKWVDLTDEEIDAWTPEIHGVIRSIEQALKEKNGCA